MAIGIGLMLGFRFIENFNLPYISRSITEFWRRWHISLSTWLRDYLYIPLGGNRKGKARTYVNLFLTMLLGGLWHGANWTFVIWGAWHGAIMAIERACGIRGATDDKIAIAPRVIRTAFTFFLVILGWVIFRAENLDVAMNMYRGMFGLNGYGITDYLSWQLKGVSLTMMVVGMMIIFIGPIFKKYLSKQTQSPTGEALALNRSILVQVSVFLLFILAVSRLLAQSYSPFLYFQF